MPENMRVRVIVMLALVELVAGNKLLLRREGLVGEVANETTTADWVTFLMADAAYMPVLECWQDWFLKAHSTSNLRIICLDEDTCTQAKQWKKANDAQLHDAQILDPSQATSQADIKNSSWSSVSLAALEPEWPKQNYFRMYHPQLWATMLATGKSVLHSDVDAFWLSNPDALLHEVIRAHPDVDIIASQNHEPVPNDVMDKWGFVLNAGFILYRNTPALKELIKNELLLEEDDQSILNHVLAKRVCEWTVSSGSSRVGRCGKLKVVTLANESISRVNDVAVHPFQFHETRIVSHPDTGALHKEGIDRMSVLRDLKLCK